MVQFRKYKKYLRKSKINFFVYYKNMATTQQFEEHPIWDRKLNELDKKKIHDIMESNPAIDYLLAETIVLMPPERFKEICENHKNNPREPEPAKVLTKEEMHTGKILSEEEQKEVEEERDRIDNERYALYEKMQKEKEEKEKVDEFNN